MTPVSHVPSGLSCPLKPSAEENRFPRPLMVGAVKGPGCLVRSELSCPLRAPLCPLRFPLSPQAQHYGDQVPLSPHSLH